MGKQRQLPSNDRKITQHQHHTHSSVLTDDSTAVSSFILVNSEDTGINTNCVNNNMSPKDTVIASASEADTNTPIISSSTSSIHPPSEQSAFASNSQDNATPSQQSPLSTSIILDQQALVTFDEYLKKQFLINNNLNINNNRSNNIINFTKGFILGQFSVIVIIVIFIKFFVFSESVPKNSTKSSKKSLQNKLFTNDTIINGNGYTTSPAGTVKNTKNSKSGTSEGRDIAAEEDNEMLTLINTILEKTYYNVNTHQTESLDWFNVLVAQIITQFRTEALYENNILNSLNEFLISADEKHKIPDWLDTIKIKEINIGNDFPIFSNCRIIKNQFGKLEGKIDVDLSDTLTLAIETKILINKPKLLTAALPIQLSVSIVRFSGCLSISLDSIPTGNNNDNDSDNKSNNNQNESSSKKNEDDLQPLHLGGVLNFGFSSDYRLEFKTESLIGARSKLENVPKISYLIENQLQNWFVERCVEPRFQLIPLPNMWPRKKNTRGNI